MLCDEKEGESYLFLITGISLLFVELQMSVQDLLTLVFVIFEIQLTVDSLLCILLDLFEFAHFHKRILSLPAYERAGSLHNLYSSHNS